MGSIFVFSLAINIVQDNKGEMSCILLFYIRSCRCKLLIRLLNNVSVCMGYYAKLLLVCRLRRCNPLRLFEVDSCFVLKSLTFIVKLSH